ncbi:anti-repressor SinI family protein [Neobacillus niacini]|uniref:anti-repressor SinI family protein n=1 Tax=Neobacillus niacini TaxID=86668 RepID=UPI00288B451B|nr:anti-repressor SinI family protein [Neobacillus niacini]
MSTVIGRMEIIDNEWLALILEAKELGLSVEEVRDFLNGNKALGPETEKKASYKN